MVSATRDKLVRILSLVSDVLQSNKPVPEDAKKRIYQRINEAVQLLTELSSSEPILDDSTATFEERMIVGLATEERRRIVQQMLLNKDAFNGPISEEDKSKLITENRKIASQLVNPVRSDGPIDERSVEINENRGTIDQVLDRSDGEQIGAAGDETEKSGEPSKKKKKGK